MSSSSLFDAKLFKLIVFFDSFVDKGIELIRRSLETNNPQSSFWEAFCKFSSDHRQLRLPITFSVAAYRRIFNFKSSPDKPPDGLYLLALHCHYLIKYEATRWYGSHCKFIRYFIFLNDLKTYFTIHRELMFSRLLHKRPSQRKIQTEKWVLEQLGKKGSMSEELLKMLSDYEASAELEKSYLDYQKQLHDVEPEKNIKMAIYTLRDCLWPLPRTADNLDIKFPPVMERAMLSFEKFFYSEIKDKNINWLHEEGLVIVKLNFMRGKRCEMEMQTFHSIILLLFETINELAYSQISAATGLDKTSLDLYLVDLVKTGILTVSEQTDDYDNYNDHESEVDEDSECDREFSFAPSTRIKLNLDFRSNWERIYVKPSALGNGESHTSANGDRSKSFKKLKVEAAILRIMKSRKSASRDELVGRVLVMMKDRFLVGGPMIRERIDKLVKRGRLRESAEGYEYILSK